MRQRRLLVTGTGIRMMPILPRLGDTGENPIDPPTHRARSSPR
jgi:hypothetical protein